MLGDRPLLLRRPGQPEVERHALGCHTFTGEASCNLNDNAAKWRYDLRHLTRDSGGGIEAEGAHRDNA
jgi:hypothetical protein